MEEDQIQPVSKAAARLFLTQCIGTYSGHMSAIAFSPTIKAIADAHGVNTNAWDFPSAGREFARFLRQVAAELDPPEAKPSAREWDIHCYQDGSISVDIGGLAMPRGETIRVREIID